MKKFFDKLKTDHKFSKLGGGQRLSSSSVSSSETSNKKTAGRSSPRQPPGELSAAARAAEARIKIQERQNSPLDTSLRCIKQQARLRDDMDDIDDIDDTDDTTSTGGGSSEVNVECSGLLVKQGIFYICPVCTLPYPRPNMESHLQSCLYNEFETDKSLAPVAMIHTLNRNLDKVCAGVEILCKYIDNICTNPSDEKYRKIRLSNKIFQDKVSPLKGSMQFLSALGFHTTTLLHNGIDEEFLVMPEECVTDVSETSNLRAMQELLLIGEPLRPELDRCVKIFSPSSENRAGKFDDLPDEFFQLSTAELRREQQLRTTTATKLTTLRTKEKREYDELPEIKKYKYTLIRVRFPEGILLQATFRACEDLMCLRGLIQERLSIDWCPYTLSTQTGVILNKETSTLVDLHLVPTAIINFQWDKDVLRDLIGEQEGVIPTQTLNNETMGVIQPL